MRARPGRQLTIARQQMPTQPSSTQESLRYPAAGYPPRQPPPQQQYPPAQPRQASRPPQEDNPQYQQQYRGQRDPYEGQRQAPGPRESGGGRSEQGWGPQAGRGRQPVDPRAGQLVLRRRPMLPRFARPTPGSVLLSYRDIVNKEMISKSSGNSMGVISSFYADPNNLAVVAAQMRPKGLGSKVTAASAGTVPLDYFDKVSDVVLVHSEAVLDPAQLPARFFNLLGCQIYTAQKEKVGKVRSYTFCPETGQIDSLEYDELSLPISVPAVRGLWEVGVDAVEFVNGQREIYLLPGASRGVRLSEGVTNWLSAIWKSLSTEGDAEEDAAWFAWRQELMPWFYANYKMLPPINREELLAFDEMIRAKDGRGLPRYMIEYAAEGKEAEGKLVAATPRAQAMVSSLPAPTSRDPRQRSPYQGQPQQVGRSRPNLAQVQNQRQAAARQQPAGAPPRAVASVPLYDTSPTPSYRQRDVDGGYGEPQEATAFQAEPASGSQAFQEWLEPQEVQREPMLRNSGRGDDRWRGYAGGGGAPSQQGYYGGGGVQDSRGQDYFQDRMQEEGLPLSEYREEQRVQEIQFQGNKSRPNPTDPQRPFEQPGYNSRAQGPPFAQPRPENEGQRSRDQQYWAASASSSDFQQGTPSPSFQGQAEATPTSSQNGSPSSFEQQQWQGAASQGTSRNDQMANPTGDNKDPGTPASPATVSSEASEGVGRPSTEQKAASGGDLATDGKSGKPI